MFFNTVCCYIIKRSFINTFGFGVYFKNILYAIYVPIDCIEKYLIFYFDTVTDTFFIFCFYFKCDYGYLQHTWLFLKKDSSSWKNIHDSSEKIIRILDIFFFIHSKSFLFTKNKMLCNQRVITTLICE